MAPASPYRESELGATRPSGPPDAWANLPDARVAGALMLTNAALAIAVQWAEARAGLVAPSGILGLGAALDLLIGAALTRPRLRVVNPRGLRRFAMLRQVLGVCLSLAYLSVNVPGAVFGALASLVPLPLLIDAAHSRSRRAVAAAAQLATLLAAAWIAVWSIEGQRLGWGAVEHARGHVGAVVSGHLEVEEHALEVDLPSGWWRAPPSRDDRALDLVNPAWGATLTAKLAHTTWDAHLDDAQLRMSSWISELDARHVPHGRATPLDLPRAQLAVVIRLGAGDDAVDHYAVDLRDGDASAAVDATVPARAHAWFRDELRAVLASVRVHGASVATLVQQGAPLDAVTSPTVVDPVQGWSMPISPGWWRVREEAMRPDGATVAGRLFTVPFEGSVLHVERVQAPSVRALADNVERMPNVHRVAWSSAPELPGSTLLTGLSAHGTAMVWVLVAPRGDDAIVASVMGWELSAARWREAIAMVRGARLTTP